MSQGPRSPLWSLLQVFASLAWGCCPESPLELESSQKAQVGPLNPLGMLGWVQGWLQLGPQPILWDHSPTGHLAVKPTCG